MSLESFLCNLDPMNVPLDPMNDYSSGQEALEKFK